MLCIVLFVYVIVIFKQYTTPAPPPLSPSLINPRNATLVSLNLCFSNQNAPCVKVIWVFFQLLLCLLHLLWDVLCCRLQTHKKHSTGEIMALHELR